MSVDHICNECGDKIAADNSCGCSRTARKTPTINQIARRFERLIAAAKDAGIVVVDDGNGAIRLIDRAEYDAAGDDIRRAGVTVKTHDGCNNAGLSGCSPSGDR